MYDSRFKDFKGKLMTRWLGPYLVENCYENGSVEIRKVDEEGIPLLVNGYHLKLYKIHLSKEEFISAISNELNVIGRLTSLNSTSF